MDTAAVYFDNQDGRRFGPLVISATSVGLRGIPALLVLDPKEAELHGEAPVQLLEGSTYEYSLEGSAKPCRLVPNSRVHPSVLSAPGERGLIQTGQQIGLLPLSLVDGAGNIAGRAFLEVRAAKITYRNDYRTMLNDIALRSTDLLLEISAPTQVRLKSAEDESADSLQRRFAFLRAVLDSADFWEALGYILDSPQRTVKQERVERDIRQGIKPGDQNVRALAGGRRRLTLPNGHPLSTQINDVPARIPVRTSIETIDTPENRFLRFVLSEFEGFLVSLERRLRRLDSPVAFRIALDAARLRERLGAVLALPFFRELSTPAFLPYGSTVLQRRRGYQTVLRTWLKFNTAALLTWDGGQDVFGAGVRDLAKLYEYWVFFQLVDLVSTRCRFCCPPAQKLIEQTQDGFGLKLKSGRSLTLEGVFNTDTRNLKVQLSYNEPFPYTQSDGAPGELRPDSTLSLWPEGFEPTDAEKQGLMVRVHFDAKYRLEIDDGDLQAGPLTEDMLKMHAYRSAIRGTEAAYVVYPGTRELFWRPSGEVLPCIGALPLCPGSSRQGQELIRNTLDAILAHICNRASGREALRFHESRIYASLTGLKPAVAYPERESSGNRPPPPAEQLVVLAAVQDALSFDRVQKEGLFWIPSPNDLDPAVFRAGYLLLFLGDGQGDGRLFALERPVFPRAEADAAAQGWLARERHIGFKVRPETGFSGVAWHVPGTMVNRLKTGQIEIATLLTLLNAATPAGV